MVTKLERLRELLNRPLVLTSGLRCAYHNQNVGGVGDSEHTTGEAADVACVNSRDRFFLIARSMVAGFTRIGIGKTFVHLGTSTDHDGNVIWLYS